MATEQQIVQTIVIETSQAEQSLGTLEQGIHQVGEQFIFTNEQLNALTGRYGQLQTVAAETSETMVAGAAAATAAIETQTVATEGLGLSMKQLRVGFTDVARSIDGQGLSLRNLTATMGLFNPAAFAVLGAIAAIGYEVYESGLKIRTMEDAFNSLTDAVVKDVGKQIGEVKVLISTIEDETTSEKARKQAIQDLIDQHPAQFKNLKDTSDILKTLKKDEEDYTKAIIDNAYIKAAESEIDKLAADNIKKQINLREALTEFKGKTDEQVQERLGQTLIQLKQRTDAEIAENNRLIQSYVDIAKVKTNSLTDKQEKRDEANRKREEAAKKRREKLLAAEQKKEDREALAEQKKEDREALAEANHEIRQAKIKEDEEKHLAELLKLEETYLIKSDELEKNTAEAKTKRENDDYKKLVDLANGTIAQGKELDATLESLAKQHQANLAAIQKTAEDEAAKKQKAAYDKEIKAVRDFARQEETIINDHLKKTVLGRAKNALDVLKIKENEVKQEIAIAKKYVKDTTELEKQLTAVKSQELEAQTQINQAKIDEETATASAIGKILGTVSGFAAQGTQTWKDLKIAETTIDSLAAFAKAQSAAVGYFAVQDYVQGAIAEAAAVEAIVQGVVNIKKIEDTKVPGAQSSGSSSTLPSAGGGASFSAPNAPAPGTQSMSISQSSLTQMQNQNQKPIQVSIGVSEITTAQTRAATYTSQNHL